MALADSEEFERAKAKLLTHPAPETAASGQARLR